jgi:hypothetical protein
VRQLLLMLVKLLLLRILLLLLLLFCLYVQGWRHLWGWHRRV